MENDSQSKIFYVTFSWNRSIGLGWGHKNGPWQLEYFWRENPWRICDRWIQILNRDFIWINVLFYFVLKMTCTVQNLTNQTITTLPFGAKRILNMNFLVVTKTHYQTTRPSIKSHLVWVTKIMKWSITHHDEIVHKSKLSHLSTIFNELIIWGI